MFKPFSIFRVCFISFRFFSINQFEERKLDLSIPIALAHSGFDDGVFGTQVF